MGEKLFLCFVCESYLHNCNLCSLMEGSFVVSLSRSLLEEPLPGFTLLDKLKFEHIRLTGHSKMRVDLAAQVRYIYLTIFCSYCGIQQSCCQSLDNARRK